jgi:hypothetical protein
MKSYCESGDAQSICLSRGDRITNMAHFGVQSSGSPRARWHDVAGAYRAVAQNSAREAEKFV